MEENRASKAFGNIGQQDLLTDRVYRELQGAILSHQLESGKALSVPELARQFDVSRSPVREAVQRLVYDGLAITVPYRGAVVTHIGIHDLLQLYEVRELLEGLAARRATERLSDSIEKELREIAAEHERSLTQGRGLGAHIELDMRLHRRIREIAGNIHLTGVLENLQEKVRLAMHSLWYSDDAPWHALKDHKEVLSAMSSGDPSKADTAMRAHIARVRATLLENAKVEARGDP